MKKICEVDFCNEAEPPGEQEVYHTPRLPSRGTSASYDAPCRRSDASKNIAPSSKIFEILRTISSEKTFEFYYRNRAQLA